MKKITLLLVLVCSMSMFATRYLVQTGAPGAATWRAEGAGEVLVNLTTSGQSLTQWLTATTFTSGDQVWIVAGTYNVSSTYAFPTAGLSIIGGFAGNESDPSERAKGENPWNFTNETLIYGNLATQIFSPGGVRVGSLIDGLSITRGGSGSASGVILRDGITLQNCYFYGNVSTGNGGAILMNGGGNVYNSYFYGNTGNSGGAIHCGTAASLTSTISNCIFESNSASGGANNLGGALRSQAAGKLNVNNCIFKNNTAVANGSAVHIQLGAVSETQNTILTNCLLYGNTNKSALYMLGGILQNSTIVNNEVGGVYVASATISSKIYNSVFWGAESSGSITSVASNASAVIQNTAYRSIQSANFTGSNNINNILLDANNTGSEPGINYPEFIEPATNNWELGYKSALLNTGQAIAAVTTDLSGTSRPQGASYDIGAYELPYFNTTVTFNAGGTVNALTSGDILSEPKGKPLAFTITPSGGQQVASVKYNNVEVKEELVDGVYTAPALAANATLVVEFSATTSVNEINSGFVCFANGNSIEIRGMKAGEEINVYSITGAALFTQKAVNNSMSVPVARGIYIVKAANQVKKVVVD